MYRAKDNTAAAAAAVVDVRSYFNMCVRARAFGHAGSINNSPRELFFPGVPIIIYSSWSALEKEKYK